MISAIVAKSENNVIGRDGKIPWHISADLKRFKEITTDGVVIMGRKTHDSIGRDLPNRINIVLSRQPINRISRVAFFSDSKKCLDFALGFNREVFIIGGQEVYRTYWDKVQKLYLTEVKERYFGDTFFDFDLSDFKQLSVEDKEENSLKYRNFVYERNNPRNI